MPPKENKMGSFTNEPKYPDDAEEVNEGTPITKSESPNDPISMLGSLGTVFSAASGRILFNSEDQPGDDTSEEDEENPDANLTEEELVDKYISNVFENGLDTNMILQSRCPICGFQRKKAVEMIVLKKKFGRFYLHHPNPENSGENPHLVVGISTMCQNCGHFDIFGTLIQDVLYYLRGKGDKCKGRVEALGTRGGSTNE